MWLPILITLLVGYLLGNLNGAYSMSVLIAHEDVRTKGSGNAGLTNFIRNFGAANGLLVILIDAGKAVVSCMAGGLLLQPYGYFTEGAALAGVAVMIGHVFPALLGFKGGKGILSGLFIAVVVDWRIGLLILAVFAIAYFTTQYVSLGSVLAAVAFAIGFAVLHWDSIIVAACGVFMGGLAIVMHRENIRRLLKGEERKTNLFGKGEKK